jgi:hypothetical protein
MSEDEAAIVVGVKVGHQHRRHRVRIDTGGNEVRAAQPEFRIEFGRSAGIDQDRVVTR